MTSMEGTGNIVAAAPSMSLRDRLLHTKTGQAMVAAAAALSFSGAHAMTAEAASLPDLGGGDQAPLVGDTHPGTSAQDPTCETSTTPFSTPGFTNNGSLTTKTCTEFQYKIGKSEMSQSDLDSGRFLVLTTGKAMSRAKVRRLKAAGRCMTIGAGTKNPWFLNQGHNGTGTQYGWDHTRLLACRGRDGVLRSTRCNNKLKLVEQPPEHPVQTLFVRNRATARLRVSAESSASADATATCDGSSATGSGNGHGSSGASMRIGVFARAHSKGKTLEDLRTRASISGRGHAEADANSDAQASATCESHGGGGGGGHENLPPHVEVDNPNHVLVNKVIAFCEIEGDTDGTIVEREFKIEQGGGNWVSNPYAGNDPGEFCRDYRGPSVPTPEGADLQTQGIILSAEVTDNDGQTAKDVSNAFPVADVAK